MCILSYNTTFSHDANDLATFQFSMNSIREYRLLLVSATTQNVLFIEFRFARFFECSEVNTDPSAQLLSATHPLDIIVFITSGLARVLKQGAWDGFNGVAVAHGRVGLYTGLAAVGCGRGLTA
jgi:hypothetical protein